MRGACFTYQVTKDQKLYAVLTETVQDMMSVQDGEGRISTYSKEVEFNGWDIWGRKYIMLGFQYFYEICTNEALKAQIMDVVIRHADYIIAHIGEEESKKSVVKASDHWGGVNSSSILEPYMRLYNMTGKERYLTFSRYLVERGGCENLNLWQSALDNIYAPYELPITKAYEIMSYFVRSRSRCRMIRRLQSIVRFFMVLWYWQRMPGWVIMWMRLWRLQRMQRDMWMQSWPAACW